MIDVDIALAFLEKVIDTADEEGLISKEHFSVDGTLLEGWPSLKSFEPKENPPPGEPPSSEGRNGEVDFHGEKRCNQTRASTTDPEALLAKKSSGKEAKLCYTGHALTENLSGLVENSKATQATRNL